MIQGCVVARYVNGITLNDYEYLVDAVGECRVFENKEAAMGYLKDEGITDEEIEWFRFFDYQKLQNGVYEEVE